MTNYNSGIMEYAISSSALNASQVIIIASIVTIADYCHMISMTGGKKSREKIFRLLYEEEKNWTRDKSGRGRVSLNEGKKEEEPNEFRLYRP